MINIWMVGNTGVRNPLRIQDSFRVYAESSLVGQIRSVEGSVKLMNLMARQGILVNGVGKDSSGSYGRKWRLAFNLYGFTFPDIGSDADFRQEELGPVDEITPFGKTFLQADSVPAIQECFLRAMSMPLKKTRSDSWFSPLCWVLAVLLKIEQYTGDPSISFLEFSVLVQTSDPTFNIEEVVHNILNLRERRNASATKRKFDNQTYKEIGKGYPKKSENFKEYGDMNLRYLRASGIFQRKGRGITVVLEKHALASQLASVLLYCKPGLQQYTELCTGPRLPSDNIDVATEMLADLMRHFDARRIPYDLSCYSLHTEAGVNNARHSLEVRLSQINELLYAEQQCKQWEEIYEYMALISRRGKKKRLGEDYEITIPKEEAAAYFEWVIWRAFLAIDSLVNMPYEARRFRIDQDFFPVNTAPGNGPDIIIEFRDFVLVIEVTLSENSRQEAMEGEPVRRHVADLILEYSKPVYGIFLANKIDSNTAETFRIGVWYSRANDKLNLNIVPFTLAEFAKVFRAMFLSNNVAPDHFVLLIKECEKYRPECEAPEWKTRISQAVERIIYAIQHSA